MKIQGSERVQADPGQVWDLVMNPESLKRIVPGCNELRQVNATQYEGQAHLDLGPIKGVYTGKLALVDQQRPESCRLEFHGQGPGGALDGKGMIRLVGGEGGTLIRYEGDFQVSGLAASLGQRFLMEVGKRLVSQGLKSLEVELTTRTECQASASR